MYSPKNMYDVLKESVMFYDRVMSLWVNNKCNKVIKEQIEEIVHDDLVQELGMSRYRGQTSGILYGDITHVTSCTLYYV